MNKKVYIIILNYNGWYDTIECLDSVLQSDFTNFQVIIVDNNSKDNSINNIVLWLKGGDISEIESNMKNEVHLHPLKSHNFILLDESAIQQHKSDEQDPIILIQANKNGGYAFGNNLGIKYALSQNDFDYIWILNNDTVVQPKTLNTLVTYFDKSLENTQLGILGSVQMHYDQPCKIQSAAGGFNKWKANFWDHKRDDISVNDIAYVHGASTCISKSFIEQVGLMNEEYFIYYEEIDWAERARQKNFKIDVCFAAKILHKHGATISKEKPSFQRYYFERNKIIFYKNFYPYLLFIPIRKLLKHVLKNFIRRRKINPVIFKALKDGLLSRSTYREME